MKPTGQIESREFRNSDFVIGVDEVGLGCLAGPVVACACLVSKDEFNELKRVEGIKDSKLLSYKKREEISKLIKSKKFRFKIFSVSSELIDSMGIYEAVQLAMLQSIRYLIKKYKLDKPAILIDGNRRIKKLDLEHKVVIKGDRKVFSIATASILAKVYRDSLMTEYESIYPGYDFGVHKGYGTKKHREAIRKIGVSPIHRKSYTLL